jgi:hypothetical protein
MSDEQLLVRGSCLCGSIRYEVMGPLRGALNCHCSMCRKAHGAAFRSRAAVRRADFQFTQGESLLSRYESSRGNYRCFCSRCGSPLVSFFDADPNTIGLPLGALDDDPGVRPGCHVHVASKAPWYEITDELPRFDEVPPSFIKGR